MAREYFSVWGTVAAEGMQPARLVWRAVAAADRIARRDVAVAFRVQKAAQYYICTPFLLFQS